MVISSNSEYTTKLSLRINRQNLLLFICFFLSSISPVAVIAFATISILYYNAKNDSIGLAKAFALYVLRVSAMNHVLFAPVTYGAIKYALMVAYALSLIIMTKANYTRKNKIIRIAIPLIIYGGYTTIVSLLNGSYPVVSLIKLTLFIIAFYSILKTVAYTIDSFDWIDYFYKWYRLVMLICVISIPFGILRTKNGHALQGIFDHPNIFAIYCAMFITLWLSKKEKKIIDCLFLPVILFMQYLSEARTGMFASLIIIAVFLLFKYRHRLHKIVLLGIGVLIVIYTAITVFPEAFGSVTSKISEFVWKSADDNLFYSRTGQIERFLTRFSDHPLWGSGFMAPYEPGKRSFEIAFDLYIEQGNLFFAILGETGIIGLLFWLLLYGNIYVCGNKDNT